jgi:hypothetical protein
VHADNACIQMLAAVAADARQYVAVGDGRMSIAVRPHIDGDSYVAVEGYERFIDKLEASNVRGVAFSKRSAELPQDNLRFTRH